QVDELRHIGRANAPLARNACWSTRVELSDYQWWQGRRRSTSDWTLVLVRCGAAVVDRRMRPWDRWHEGGTVARPLTAHTAPEVLSGWLCCSLRWYGGKDQRPSVRSPISRGPPA